MNDFCLKLWKNRNIRYALLGFMSLLAVVSLVQGIRNAAEFSQDFQWDAAKVFILRINPYEESMNPSGVLDSYGFEEYYLQMEANQFPSLLMLLIPFTLLPPLAARYVWIICNIFFTLGIIFLLRKTFLKHADRDIFILFSLLMVAGTPYRNQLGVGQHTLFSFFFFLLAVWFSEQKSDIKNTTGMIISLFICYFKYTLTVPLCLYFIFKKKYKEIIISALMHVALTVVAAIWLGSSVTDMIIQPLKVSGALAAEGGIDFGVLLKGSPLAYVLAFVVLLALLVIGLYTDEKSTGLYMSVLVLWSLIITYHRTYDFWVMIVILALFTEKNRSSFLKWFYGIDLIAVFFVLRIFSESDISKLAVGIIYYAFAIAVTALLIKECRKKKLDNKN